MAWKINKKFGKERKFPKGYWEDRKIEEINKRKKGKLPPYKVIVRTADENVTGATERIHTKGQMVMYKDNKLAIVRHVTQKGVWVEQFEGDDVIDSTKTKLYFIPEEEYSKHAEPVFISAPFYFAPIIQMK
jgi:hypothetical protein